MRVIRGFAVGLGAGYLIWSGTGRKLIDKLSAARDRAVTQRKSRPSGPASTEAAVTPADMAVPTVGADPLVGVSVAVHESTRTARRAS